MTDSQALAIVKQLDRIADVLESIDETLNRAAPFSWGTNEAGNFKTEVDEA